MAKRNTRKMAGTTALAAGAMVLALLWFKDSTVKQSRVIQKVGQSRVGNIDPGFSQTQGERSSANNLKEMPQALNYKEMFGESRDYWIFAHKVLTAAKAGDADAQFYLFRSLERCADDNSMYFQHRGRTLELDEGLRFAVQRHLPIEIAQEVYDKCHKFLEQDSTDLGSAQEWLAKATDAGQPLAEATTASKILMQHLQKNFARASGGANAGTAAAIDSSFDPRELLRAAVQSKDPEVLFSIGEDQAMLDPSNTDKSINRYAWWLVACQRGLDCSGSADWVKNACASDPQCASANSPSDLVRTLSGDNWPDVQQRAREIADKLDHERWDDLGIGS